MRKGLHAINLMRFAAGSYRPTVGPAKVTWQVGDHDSTVQIKKVVRDLAECGVLQVIFGCEVFLRTDAFDLIDFASRIGLFTSANVDGGTIRRIGAGLIKSSLGALYVCAAPEAMQSISKNRRGAKPRLFMNITITADNCSDMSDIVRLAVENGADGVTLRAACNGAISAREYARRLEEQIGIIKRDYSQFMQYPAEYLDNMVTYVRDPKSLYRYKCVAGYSTAFIKSDGEVCACPAGDFPLGNLREQSFQDIWFSDRADQVRKDIREDRHPMCWTHSVAPITITAAYLRPWRMPMLLEPDVLRHMAWG